MFTNDYRLVTPTSSAIGKRERQKRYENMVKQANKAQDEYTEAIKDMPGSGEILRLSLAEGVVNSVKPIAGLLADISLGTGSFNYAHDSVRGTHEQSKRYPETSTKPCDVQLAEHTVPKTVPLLDANIQNLALMIGTYGHIPDFNTISKNIGTLEESLSRYQEIVSEEKESLKLGVQISELCKKAKEICTEAQIIWCEIASNRTVVELQNKVLEIRTESMSLVAKANKRLGRNPLDEKMPVKSKHPNIVDSAIKTARYKTELDEKSPCLEKMSVQSENPNIVISTMETGRFKTELAKEILRDAKKRQKASDKQLEEANERLYEALNNL